MNQSFFSDIICLLKSEEIALYQKKYDFNHARKVCFNSIQLNAFIKERLDNKEIIAISTGTSDRYVFSSYLKTIVNNFENHIYYRDYGVSKGNYEARQALSFLESLKLSNGNYYTPEEVCLTDGATGAISAFLRYIKKKSPRGNVLIASPTYYLPVFLAKKLNIQYKEIIGDVKKNKSFISVPEILNSIDAYTKAILIVNPTNPGGEIYSQESIKTLLDIARKKNLLILSDDIFANLAFKESHYYPIDRIASDMKLLKNVVVVKSYSKSMNLPGLRIGYIYSKNKTLIDEIGDFNEETTCFPTASIYSQLIILDSFFQATKYLMQTTTGTSLESLVKIVKKEFSFNSDIQLQSLQEIIKTYIEYEKFTNNKLLFYSNCYDRSIDILNDEIDFALPKQSAFNTFIKIKDLQKVNMFDFVLNLFIFAGIKIEMGPCFGLSQKQWQDDPNLGFWLRITFAQDAKQMIRGVKRFIEFKNLYLKDPRRFLKTNLDF